MIFKYSVNWNLFRISCRIQVCIGDVQSLHQGVHLNSDQVAFYVRKFSTLKWSTRVKIVAFLLCKVFFAVTSSSSVNCKTYLYNGMFENMLKCLLNVFSHTYSSPCMIFLIIKGFFSPKTKKKWIKTEHIFYWGNG